MKLSLKSTILAVAACFILAGPAQAQTKFGTIDLKKVFDGYWKTKQANANIKERMATMEKKRVEMVDDYKKAGDEYTKLQQSTTDQAVSTEERDKRKKAAETKLLEIKEIEQSITQYERSAQSQIMEQQRSVRDKIVKEIRESVDAISKAHGFTMVFDTAAESINNTPVLLYNTGENDITDEVLKHVNSTAPIDLPNGDGDKKGDNSKEKKKK